MAIGSRNDPEMRRLTIAIRQAGATGITAKQLAGRMRVPPAQVEDRLRTMAADRSIVRHGRGLWSSREYADDLGPGFRGPAHYAAAFREEYGVAVVPVPTPIQFRPNETRPVHRWWPYVQGFSAEWVETVLRRYGVGPGSVVLDPFCGSGTVPAAARSLGAAAVGTDLLPIAAFVARAKLTWDVAPERLRSAAERILAGGDAPRRPLPFLRETRRQFAPAVLRRLLVLRDRVLAEPDDDLGSLLRLAFAGILIDASRLKRAPCLGYTEKPGQDAATPDRLWRARIAAIADDLAALAARRATWGPEGSIALGSVASRPIDPGSVDLAVTSPPYVNGMDYVMNYKIDLAWMGFVRSYPELARLRASMVACDNIPRSVAEAYAPTAGVRGDPWLAGIVREIERNIRRKGTYRRTDMARVVSKYFDDLVPAIDAVHRALRPGGRFVVVNGDSLIAGTYIPGDLLFARLAARSGFRIESVEVARTRRSGQRRGFALRESVLTLQKPAEGAGRK
jgi:DNA modification methylase